jgi:uncharacterized membrane protein
MYLNFGKYLYTIIYVLIALIIVMMFLSYFNINLNQSNSADDNVNLKLTRAAIFEGYKHKSDTETDTIMALNSIS